ncbi:MAG TPA: methionine biosynthesis protein MetW [Rhodospirillales bacterium]|nr:methionine biosynthesis protein MetW [Rhodospirillales bacterium]HJO69460.1 methionine biosynthesis protein MetW [Rhodospirillales bacterium]
MTEDHDRNTIRIDLQRIADMIEPKSRVLDVGCGDGALLENLARSRQVDGRGVELSAEGVNACVSAGLSVIQGDADTDLDDYPENAFDFVVLSQTLQTVHAPRKVLENLLRIGRRAIVSFPNFGHWRVRAHLFFRGRMPINDTLPYQWYSTPNIHLCSIRDFVLLCEEMGITIERSISLDHKGRVRRIGAQLGLANLFGEQAVFLLRR